MHINRIIQGISLVALLAGCFSVPDTRNPGDSKQQQSQAPIVWGTLSQCNGCVIFKENKKTDVGFWVVAFTWSTRSQLEVFETYGYDLEPATWSTSQESIDELQRLAIRDRIRYVKIPGDFTPDELYAARVLCHKSIID